MITARQLWDLDQQIQHPQRLPNGELYSDSLAVTRSFR